METLTRRGLISRIVAVAGLAFAGVTAVPAAIANTALRHLHRIRGMIIRRADSDYELSRSSMVWYIFKPDRFPDTIIRAESEQDVIEAVNYAREQGLKLATRATGHNPARGCLRNGGVLLDLSRLREVTVDANAGTAWVEPGIRSEDFIEITHPLGWAFPAAHTGIVGLGGYIIGGGLGWNMGDWDIACRSIIGAEIVMADGEKLTVSPTENADLLWAIRGAGPGFFGAVLRYKVKLFPTAQVIIKSKYLVPIDKMPELMHELEEITAAKDRRLEIIAVVGRFAPPNEPPERRDLVGAVSAIAFGHSREDGLALLEPVRRSALPGMSILKKEGALLSWSELYAGQETDFSSPRRTAIHNIWTDDPGAGLLALAERMQVVPPRSPRSFVLSAWGINPSRDNSDSSLRYAADHYISWYQMAETADDIEPNFKWMDESVELMQPYTRGHYVNEFNSMRYPEALEVCFGRKNWKQLNELRRKYDPKGVFHSYLGQS